MRLQDFDTGDTYTAHVISSERITPENTDEVRNLVLSIDNPGFEYQDGQSVGVLIPGPHEFGNHVCRCFRHEGRRLCRPDRVAAKVRACRC